MLYYGAQNIQNIFIRCLQCAISNSINVCIVITENVFIILCFAMTRGYDYLDIRKDVLNMIQWFFAFFFFFFFFFFCFFFFFF